MDRSALLDELAARIRSHASGRIVRVAITGVDGAGKTRFANDLGDEIAASGLPVIRASIDGFHNPRALRYTRGRTSPEGFLRDSFDLNAFRSLLLDPLSPGGTLAYRRAAFDHRTDLPVDAPVEVAQVPSVLLVDGIFLLQPELRAYWDLSVFLDVPFAVSFARMALRDGSPPDEHARENQRYRQGQLLHFEEDNPRDLAAIVIDYADFDSPVVLKS